MPLPDFEFKEEEQDLGLLSFRETIQKVNQLNFKDVNFGAIRPGAGSVIEGSLIVKGSVEPEKLTGLGDLAYEDAVEKAKLGATIIDGGYIVTGMINASRIDTGTLSADRLSVSELNALNIKAGSVDAEDITGNTITGKTLRTASSGQRVQIGINETSQVTFYDSNGSLAGALDAERISGSPVLTLFHGSGTSAKLFQIGSFSGEASTVRMMAGGLSGTGIKVYDGSDTVRVFGDLDAQDDVDISGNLSIAGRIEDTLEPSSNASYDLGTSTRRWDRVYFDSRLYMYGTTSSRSFVLPNVAGGSNIGSPSLYFNQMYADNVSYKSLNSFDHINDIEAMKKIKLKTVEVEEPDEVGKKEKKMITKQVWDFNSLPKDTKDGEFYNAGAVSGFIIGSIKELIKKVETLESQLQELKNKV